MSVSFAFQFIIGDVTFCSEVSFRPHSTFFHTYHLSIKRIVVMFYSS